MPLKAVELFAGVGGFRLGLEAAGIEVIWANQWEPGRKKQWAFDCYAKRFSQGAHVNEDIAKVPAGRIPEHDLLVGGFPCQDYSVATTKAEGIQGKKGVLWWEIHRIARAKRPPFLLLENVDRLLKSPTHQRGRDFGVMLSCLANLGYRVEWRVINAADYSTPQKRRRVFIVAAHKSTLLGQTMAACPDPKDWLQSAGVLASSFPVVREAVRAFGPMPPLTKLEADIQRVSDIFSVAFENAGMMVDGAVWTLRVKARSEPIVPLSSILQTDAPEAYYVPISDLPRWRYLKGAKREERKTANGFKYRYNEGPIPYPDSLDQPSRTLITSEGGTSPSRFKHIVRDSRNGRMRVLTPLECERLNGFPDGWTDGEMPENWRYFCMGNALVVPIVARLAKELAHNVGIAKKRKQESRRRLVTLSRF